MQRREFIGWVAATLPLLSLTTLTYSNSEPVIGKPFVIRGLQSRFGVPTPFRGEIPNDLKISTKDTGNQYSFFDYVGIKQVPGPTLHLHTNQDEVFYVTEGEFVFQLGNEKLLAKKGDTIFAPRNIQHTWTQLTSKGRLEYFCIPAGKMEEFFVMVSKQNGPPTPEVRAKMEKEYGIRHIGDALSPHEVYTYSSQLSNGFVVRGGEDRFNGHTKNKAANPVNLKLAGKDTNNQLSVFDYVGNAKGGPPLHVHLAQDEVFFVLEGNYIFQAGEERFELTVGDTIFLPRKVPHTWAQVSEKGKLLFFFQPCGKMEEFFQLYSQQVSRPSPKETEKIFSDHEMTVTGPPIVLP